MPNKSILLINTTPYVYSYLLTLLLPTFLPGTSNLTIHVYLLIHQANSYQSPGLPLEMVHGGVRVGAIYLAGVIAGSLASGKPVVDKFQRKGVYLAGVCQ